MTDRERKSENTGEDLSSRVRKAAAALRTASHAVVFTGAGISVESGIPPFRGNSGIWSSYDPRMLQLDYFFRNPQKCWKVIKEIFYDFFGTAEPNTAHLLLAQWEQLGLVKSVITQNIDDLHFRAGSRYVIEYHGNSRRLCCTACGSLYDADADRLAELPPLCTCGGILKPDFVFFGENIPPAAASSAEREAYSTDVMLLIGTTGEVYPAAALPEIAKRNGAVIIEINPELSNYSGSITDIYLPTGAVMGLDLIAEELSRLPG